MLQNVDQYTTRYSASITNNRAGRDTNHSGYNAPIPFWNRMDTANILNVLLNIVIQLLQQMSNGNRDNTPIPSGRNDQSGVAATGVAATGVAATGVAATGVAATGNRNDLSVDDKSPKKIIDVFLLGGQSNAVGLGAARLEKALENSLGMDTTTHQTNVFQYAVGGTNLYSQWKADGTADSSRDGGMYKTFQAKLDGYLTSLRKENPDAQIRIVGMFWHQGESDAIGGAGAAYQENLTNFIKDVRATTHTDNLPFLIGRLSSKQTMMPVAGLASVQKAQDAVGATVSGAVTVDIETAQTSGIHFTATGYERMADLFAKAYQGNFA